MYFYDLFIPHISISADRGMDRDNTVYSRARTRRGHSMGRTRGRNRAGSRANMGRNTVHNMVHNKLGGNKTFCGFLLRLKFVKKRDRNFSTTGSMRDYYNNNFCFLLEPSNDIHRLLDVLQL